MTSLPQPEKPAEPARPREVDLAVQFWWATLVLSVVGMVISQLDIPEPTRQQFRDQAARSGFTNGELVDRLMLIGQITWLVIYLVLCGVWVLFILKMRAGRNWARVVLTTLGWITVLLTVPMVISDQLASIVFYAVTVVVEIAAIAMMFRPPANQYFTPGRVP